MIKIRHALCERRRPRARRRRPAEKYPCDRPAGGHDRKLALIVEVADVEGDGSLAGTVRTLADILRGGLAAGGIVNSSLRLA